MVPHETNGEPGNRQARAEILNILVSSRTAVDKPPAAAEYGQGVRRSIHPGATMTEHSNGAAATALFSAWERWDLDTIESLVAGDGIDNRPQSGEQFVGRAHIMAMYREVPGPPKIAWQRIRGGPDVFVAQGIVEYGEGPVHLIGIVEFADGRIVEADYYFAEAFEAPESRAQWASKTPPIR